VTSNLAARPNHQQQLTVCEAHRYEQSLLAHPRAVRRLRRIVAAHLRHWERGALEDSVGLCLTEMLTNVGRHTGSLACVLILEDTGAGVRLTISDTSQQVPVTRRPDWFAEAGRGMHLIAAAADQFGSNVTPTGKDVWAVFGIGAGVTT
jgi:hypothetical protein